MLIPEAQISHGSPKAPRTDNLDQHTQRRLSPLALIAKPAKVTRGIGIHPSHQYGPSLDLRWQTARRAILAPWPCQTPIMSASHQLQRNVLRIIRITALTSHNPFRLSYL